MLIAAHEVGRRYRRVRALDAVDLEVSPGEAVALLGPNGAGKTTLLRILAGVDRATSGRVARVGDAVVGWVPQRPAVYPRLSVDENLALFAGVADDGAARGEEVLRRADLVRYRDRPARTLSTGTLQRLNVALAMVVAPSVLLLDEPTATLSPDQRVRLWTWLEELRRSDGMALVFSTQSVGEVERHADRCVVIAHGRVAFAGTPAQLAARAAGPVADTHTAMQQAFMALVSDDDPVG